MNNFIGIAVKVGGLCQQSGSAFRGLHLSAVANTSVFMKKQKKVDPEVAKVREIRKRRKLEKEIRQLKKHGKTPKPVEEMQLDIISAKNIDARRRPPVQVPEEELDRRAAALKAFSKSRAALMKIDEDWIRKSIYLQEKALRELKELSPELYADAVKPDIILDEGIVLDSPTLTPPLPDYQSPDGDYLDTTRTWT